MHGGNVEFTSALQIVPTGQQRAKAPVVAAEPPEAPVTSTAPAKAAAKAPVTAGAAPAIPAAQTPKVGQGVTLAPTLAPVVPLGGGGSASGVEPKVTTPESTAPAKRQGAELPAAPAGPRSRILSERLEPLTSTPETPDVGPDPEPPAAPDAKDAN